MSTLDPFATTFDAIRAEPVPPDPGGEPKRLPVLTQSSMGTLISCEEKFRLSYLECLVPLDEKPYLSLGSAVHHGIEHLSADKAWEYFDAPGSSSLLGRDLTIMRGVAFAMVQAALAFWDDWPQNREIQFQVPIVNPVTGAMGLRLFELKTASSVSADYMRRLRIDLQVSIYLLAASMMYRRKVREVRYRIVGKPTIKPGKGETGAEYDERMRARAPLKRRDGESDDSYARRVEKRPPLKRKIEESVDDYLARVRLAYEEKPERFMHETIVTRTDAEIERTRHELWEYHQRVLRIENSGMTLRNASACIGRGRSRCDFFYLCVGEVGTGSFNVKPRAHVELEPIQESK